MGWTLHKDKKNYKWYGRWVNDYSEEDAAYLQGVETKDYGKCDHVISIPGCKYEAGLVKQEDGSFNLVFDNYDPELAKVLGGKQYPDVVSPLPSEYAKEVFLDKLKHSEIDVWEVSESRDEEGNLRLEIEVGE